MATMTTNLNIRMDKDVKEQAEKIFSELGLNMTTAINIFLRTSIREHGIPFSLKLDTPNGAKTSITVCYANAISTAVRWHAIRPCMLTLTVRLTTSIHQKRI